MSRFRRRSSIRNEFRSTTILGFALTIGAGAWSGAAFHMHADDPMISALRSSTVQIATTSVDRLHSGYTVSRNRFDHHVEALVEAVTRDSPADPRLVEGEVYPDRIMRTQHATPITPSLETILVMPQIDDTARIAAPYYPDAVLRAALEVPDAPGIAVARLSSSEASSPSYRDAIRRDLRRERTPMPVVAKINESTDDVVDVLVSGRAGRNDDHLGEIRSYLDSLPEHGGPGARVIAGVPDAGQSGAASGEISESVEEGGRAHITDQHFSALTVEVDAFEPDFAEVVDDGPDLSAAAPDIANMDLANTDPEQLEMVIALIASTEDPTVAADYIRSRMGSSQGQEPQAASASSVEPGVPAISSPGEAPEQEAIPEPQDLTPEISLSTHGWKAYAGADGQVMVSRGSSDRGGLAVRTGMVLGDLGRVEGVTRVNGEIEVHTSSGETISGDISEDGPVVVDAAEFAEDADLLEQLSD